MKFIFNSFELFAVCISLYAIYQSWPKLTQFIIIFASLIVVAIVEYIHGLHEGMSSNVGSSKKHQSHRVRRR